MIQRTILTHFLLSLKIKGGRKPPHLYSFIKVNTTQIKFMACLDDRAVYI